MAKEMVPLGRFRCPTPSTRAVGMVTHIGLWEHGPRESKKFAKPATPSQTPQPWSGQSLPAIGLPSTTRSRSPSQSASQAWIHDFIPLPALVKV